MKCGILTVRIKVKKILRQFDIAIESNVDGIILQAFDDQGFDTTLKRPMPEIFRLLP